MREGSYLIYIDVGFVLSLRVSSIYDLSIEFALCRLAFF